MKRRGGRRTRRVRRGGFALITVIWGLGVIALLVLGFVAAARLRAQIAGNINGAAQAGALAEAAVNIAILDLVAAVNAPAANAARFPRDGEPVFCTLPQGAAAALAVEDEGGKVDINAAPKPLLAQLLTGFGAEARSADEIAAAIITFRSPPANSLGADDREYAQAGLGYGPKHAPFQSTLELDQVLNVPQDLFRAVLPFVTVYSCQPAVNTRLAPPALLAALAGEPADVVQALAERPYPNDLDRNDPRLRRSQGAPAITGAFLIHAEVLLPNGGFFVREALVALRAADGAAYAVREWRGGAAHYRGRLEQMQGRAARSAPAC